MAAPLLFAVAQGGHDEDLPARCAEALVDVGFGGNGYDGYPTMDGQPVDEIRLVAS